MKTLDNLAPLMRDGALCFDGTMLSEMHRCPAAHYYRDIRKRVPARLDRSLGFGSVIHSALEAHYGGVRGGEALERAWTTVFGPAVDAPTDPLSLDDAPAAGAKEYLTLGRAKDVIAAYLEHYEGDDFVILGTEKPFSRHLGDVLIGPIRLPVNWQGRYDLTVRDKWGNVFVLDFKTTGRFGGKGISDPWRKWRNSSSMLGYCWNHWKETGQMPAGYVIRAIVVRPPVGKPGKATPPRDENLQHTFSVSEARLREWERNTLASIQQAVHWSEQGYWPKHDRAGYNCEMCPYLSLCECDDSEMAETLLAGGDFAANTWKNGQQAA